MSSPGTLSRLRLGRGSPATDGEAAAAAVLSPGSRQPSAWGTAFEEACLSPMASSAYGHSAVTLRSPSMPVQLAQPPVAAGSDGSEVDSEWWSAAEARRLCRLALPVSVTNLAAFCIGLVTLSFAGRLGEFELSSAVLATSIFNVTGLSLLMGFSAAMETFCGQAFGAGNYRLVGVVFQRAILITSAVSLAVAAVWSQAEGLLLLLRQEPLLARSAARYVQLTIPALWCTGVFEACKRYLLAQGVVRPASLVTLVALALSPLYGWLLVLHLDLRLYGAALTVDAVQLTMACLLGGYIVIRDARLAGRATATWHGWSWDALHGWLAYLRFALPSLVMIACEWWTFEAMILMSGWLQRPDVSLAVMGIAINTSGIVWMFVTGFAMALSARVGNSLGAGCPKTARGATWTSVGIALGLELAAMGAILALRKHWARLFTDAPEVVELTASVLPIFALSLPGDGINAVLQGLLRGSGRQETGAITNLCSYWVLGIPLAAYLAFKQHLGVHGLWWGLVAVNTVQGTIMILIALRMDFRREALKAMARSAAHTAHAAPSPSSNGHWDVEEGDESGSSGGIANGNGDGDASLRQPLLLQGPQCERLEQGLPPVAVAVDPGTGAEAAAAAAAYWLAPAGEQAPVAAAAGGGGSDPP